MSANRKSLASSPDLLGRSISDTTSSPTKRRTRISTSTPKKPSTRVNSPTKTSNNIQLQDYYLTTPPAGLNKQTSPTRSIGRQTENLISPWRIRVRVEAERDDGDNMNLRNRRVSGSPSRRGSLAKGVLEKTTTTTIPLKAGDDTPQTRRGRGRPRKSTTPAKRPSTPKPSAKKSRNQAAEAPFPTTSPKRGRPRKNSIQDSEKGTSARIASLATDESAVLGEELASVDAAQVADPTSQAGTPGPRILRERRKPSVQPVNIAIHSDADTDDVSGKSGQSSTHLTETSQRADTNGNGTSEKTGLRQISSISPQKGKTKVVSLRKNEPDDPTNQHNEFDSILEAEDMTMITLDSLPSAQRILNSAQTNADWIIEEEDEPESPQQNHKEYVQDSAQQNEIVQRSLRVNTMAPPPIPHDSVNHDDDNGTQDNTPLGNGSSILNLIKQVTPSQLFSSPRLPPPPVQHVPQNQSPRALSKPQDGIPKLARVVRAGIALQGVTSSPGRSDTAQTQNTRDSDSPPQRSPRERLDELFSGFGAGTRRELRAGLRLGEELAKRQQLADRASGQIGIEKRPSAQPSSKDDVFEELANEKEKSPSPDLNGYKLALPKSAIPQIVQCPELSGHGAIDSPARSEKGRAQAVSNPNLPAEPAKQLPSPENSTVEDGDQMDWEHDPPNPALNDHAHQQASPGSSRATEELAVPRTEAQQDPAPRKLTRHEEIELQIERERAAVSKQIREANTSQVITIHSDDPTLAHLYPNSDDEVGDPAEPSAPGDPTLDIWQMEALESSDILARSAAERKFNGTLLQPTAAISTHPQPSTSSKQTSSQDVIPPRRGKLPTPWRRQSRQQLIYSDELSSPAKPLLVQALKHDLEPDALESRKRAKVATPDFSTKSSIEPGHDSGQVERTPIRQKVSAPKESITASIMRRVTDRFYGQRYERTNIESQLEESEETIEEQPRPENPVGRELQQEREEVEPSGDEETPSAPAAPKASATQEETSANVREDDKKEDQDEDEDEDEEEEGEEEEEEGQTSLSNSLASKASIQSSSESSMQADSTAFNINTSLLSAQMAPARSVGIPFKRRTVSARASAIPSASLPQPINERLSQLQSSKFSVPSLAATTSWFNNLSSLLPSPLMTWLASSPASSSPCSCSEPASAPTFHAPQPRRSKSKSESAKPPFSVYLPFDATHWARLNKLYVPMTKVPHAAGIIDEYSPSHHLLGQEIESLGWRRALEEWELKVVDSFMVMLETEGVNDSGKHDMCMDKAVVESVQSQDFAFKGNGQKLGKGRRMIQVEDVAVGVFSLWAGRVQRGLMELRDGEAGVWDERFSERRESVLARRDEWLRGKSKVERWGEERGGRDGGSKIKKTKDMTRP